MKLERKHADENKVLSYFELNLETWRQLWRVLEISDIILVIVDIRYPVSISILLPLFTFFKILFVFVDINVPTIIIRIRH